MEPNSRDRWGKTPLDYVDIGSSLERYLMSKGCVRTQAARIPMMAVPDGKQFLSISEARLFYACYFNSLHTVHVLWALGVDLDVKDFSGRTPLHVAASEGNTEIAAFLIGKGVSVTGVDSRGEDPRTGAFNSGNVEEYDLINSVISSQIVRENCKTFSNSIFKNGMGQAMGAYHKKFQDTLIKVNSTDNYYKRLTLISGDRFNPMKYIKPEEAFSSNDLSSFITGAELYFASVITSMTTSIDQTFRQCFTFYRLLILILFIVFLAVLILCLFFLRRHLITLMSEDIFKSRGILNLIPNSFFEQNKGIVEGLMQKLKF